MPGSGLEIAHTELATQVSMVALWPGANLQNLYRRGAEYVDRILRGDKPANLPVEQADKFTFVQKTAKALNIEISPDLLARADEVIE